MSLQSTGGAETTADGRIAVTFLGVPIEIYRSTRQYHDEIIREFRLILARRDVVEGEVPPHLMSIVDEMSAEFSAFVAPHREAIESAIANGATVIDLSLLVAPTMQEWLRQFAQQFRAVDDYCERGKLLTLRGSDEVIAFREWFLRQMIDQIDGAEPEPWRWPPVSS
jgi:hypothetical protein